MQLSSIPSTLLSKLGTPEQLAKFIWVGLTNSGLTYLIYIVLNLVLDYRISYAMSFVFGILFSAYFNGRFVFRTQLSFKTVSIYAIFYFISFGVSYFLLTIFVERFTISELISPLLVLIIVAPFNFVFARLILTGKLSANSP